LAALLQSQLNEVPLFGPGTPQQDWYAIHALYPELSSDTPVTRAANLPEILDVIEFLITEPAPALERREDYPSWYYQINGKLKRKNLHILLDQSIPKPSNKDEKAFNWFLCSVYTRNWVIKAVNPYLLREIGFEGLHTEFADDLMAALVPYRPVCRCCST
jgi:hypothetical protein